MNELTIPKATGDIAKELHKPWLVAAWPGMGHVGVSAGYYMAAKLKMESLAEFSPRELFELEHVDVKDGLIQPARLPRSRFFLWTDPDKRHDIVLFIGEAQPSGKLAFCQALLGFAKHLGIERIFTFAAMATTMHPLHPSRVFVAATDQETLDELKAEDLEVLEEGRISGLNGVILGEAAAAGVPGACLLGEMPHIFSHLSFPGASLSVIKVFADLAGIPIDLNELQEQSKIVSEKFGELLKLAENELQSNRPQESQDEAPEVEQPVESAEESVGESTSESQLGVEDLRRIDKLFKQARIDRTRAYELKQELDRLGVFQDYEDQFLDLFQKPE